MDIFLRIPSELSCHIVTNWLGAKSVVFLDGAYCNKASRPSFLATVLSSHCCVISSPPGRDIFQDYLEWITLRSVRFKSIEITPDIVHSTLEDCMRRYPHLIESVSMDEFSGGMSRILELIADYCTELTSLVCTSCILTESVEELLTSCTNLEVLRLTDCLDSIRHNYTYSDSREKLKLKTVELICGEKLALCVLQHPLSSCERLKLSSATELPIYKLIEHLGSYNNLISLGFLDTDALTDDMMAQIIALRPQLSQLHLVHCGALTDVTGVAIAEKLTQLKELKMVGCFIPGITDITLSALAQHRKDTLTSLHVGDCILLTSAGHNTILSQCVKLRSYGFSYIPNINPTLLSNLTTLYLEDIRSIASFGALLSGCGSVQRLFLGLTATNSCQLNFTCLSVDLVPNLQILSIKTIWSLLRTEPPTLRLLRLLRPHLTINYNTGRFDDT